MTLGRTILLAAGLAAVSFAQQWEFGGVAGGGFLNTTNVSNSLGSATAGFQSGAAFGGYIGNNLYKHIGGELRYTYLQSDLKLASSGQTATFNGSGGFAGSTSISFVLVQSVIIPAPMLDARALLLLAIALAGIGALMIGGGGGS